MKLEKPIWKMSNTEIIELFRSQTKEPRFPQFLVQLEADSAEQFGE